ncbi:Multidrug resistance protein MexA [Methylophilaceae bacterium]|nr:Multidrug resistance protein MexA [Methylophilaceae bacterium]
MSKHQPTTQSAIILALFALSILINGCGKSSAKERQPGKTEEVGIIVIETKPQLLTANLPGRTNAHMIAEIRPQVGGIIQKREFIEGAYVKSGNVLYQIDPAPYRAVYASAEAAVEKAEANLASLKLKAQRYAELVKINAVSKQDDDDIQAALRQAQAELSLSKAALDAARINLNYTRILSPISGRVATSTVTPGALVTANQETALTTVQQLDPIYVDVMQSSNELLRLKRELARGTLKHSGADEARIRIVLEDGSAYAHEGKLKFSGVSVNATSGAVTLRAIVPNPEGLLMPGMYVHALLDEAVDERAILVPQQSVSRNSRGEPTVLLVGEGDKVEIRQISVDRAVGAHWLVTGGLSVGEKVIVDGVQKIKVGDVVKAVLVQQIQPIANESSESEEHTGHYQPVSVNTAANVVGR